MTAKRWPILDLDGSPTAAEVRRAYAKRLREQGPDADVAAFQALRAEFDAALAAARSEPDVRRLVDEAPSRRAHTAPDIPPLRTRAAPAVIAEPLPRATTPEPAERAADAVAEIRGLLANGDLLRACDRFDRARGALEIDAATSALIEADLARQWLADTALDQTVLAGIVARYHWLDVRSDFPLGTHIVARLHASRTLDPRPGERYIGQWNWGAFFLTPFWLMAHGLRGRGIRILVLTVVAFIIPLAFIALFITSFRYGRSANALAVAHRRFTGDAQFVAVQNAWRNRGITVAAVTLVFISAFVAALIVAHHH